MEIVIRIACFVIACVTLWMSCTWWVVAKYQMVRGERGFARASATLALVLTTMGGVLLARALAP